MIHKKGVVHADLKPSNILLKGRDYDITICDFGISQKLPRGTHLANQFIGSMCYCSPEVLRGEPFNSKTDIWALGCILYELCCCKRAFEDSTEEGLRSKILSYNIPQIPQHSFETRPTLKEVSKLYQLCMRRVQEQRPSVSEILSLPYVVEAAKKNRVFIGARKQLVVPEVKSQPEIMIVDEDETIDEIEPSKEIFPR